MSLLSINYFERGARPAEANAAECADPGCVLEGGGLILCVTPEAFAATKAMPGTEGIRPEADTWNAICCVVSVLGGVAGWALLVWLTFSISQLH
jgi:hypothetical protein